MSPFRMAQRQDASYRDGTVATARTNSPCSHDTTGTEISKVTEALLEHQCCRRPPPIGIVGTRQRTGGEI